MLWDFPIPGRRCLFRSTAVVTGSCPCHAWRPLLSHSPGFGKWAWWSPQPELRPPMLRLKHTGAVLCMMWPHLCWLNECVTEPERIHVIVRRLPDSLTFAMETGAKTHYSVCLSLMEKETHASHSQSSTLMCVARLLCLSLTSCVACNCSRFWFLLIWLWQVYTRQNNEVCVHGGGGGVRE